MREYGSYQGSIVSDVVGSIVVALVVIVAGVLFRPDRSHRIDESKPDGTRVTLRERIEGTGTKLERYAREAYPAWAREHRGMECPDTVDELNRYIGAGDSLDLWGHPIKLLCGPTMPPGLGGFMLVSAGKDGKFDTDDDLAPF
jgi:hypothetical protein